jgi:chemotaxis protein histidine kinase CheA
VDDFEAVMAEIRRDFYEGVSTRLAAICSALDVLDDGFDDDATHLFLRTTHSLKGASASLGDDELAQAASGLNLLAVTWVEAGRVPESEMETARDGLETLYALDQKRRASGLHKSES